MNVTPDSFSDGGLFLSPETALRHADKMLADGVDVIDVGGASSRPRGALYGDGAAPVSAQQELQRVVPVVRELVARLGAVVSVDTVRAEVAEAAIDAGAAIINDVSNGQHPRLLEVAARTGVQLVLMHTRGDGSCLPPHTQYRDLVGEVTSELQAATQRAVAAGVSQKRLWIDPGLGFAKTAEQSLGLLGRTDALVALGMPVLVGPSRKGFIGHCAPAPDGSVPAPLEREGGTAAAVTAAVLAGAAAVRVHDVAAMRQATLLASAVRAHLPGVRGAA